MTIKEAEAIEQARHGGGMLLEHIAEIMIAQIQGMSPDEKAILRVRMLRRAGLIKPNGGKPS